VSATVPNFDSPVQSTPLCKVAVVAAAEALRDRAGEVARELHLPLIESPTRTQCEFDLLLMVRPDGLAVAPTDSASGGALRVDFVRGPTAYRRVAAGGRRQPLALAVGLKRGRPAVFDATAGLGRDSFLLACLGCRVTAVERSPVLEALLCDALERGRAAGNKQLSAALDRIRLVCGDSREVLRLLVSADAPDVVYIDPMFTPREKSALAKKEMRICRMLVGDDSDAAELLDAARAVARRRVVVKRQRKAPPLASGVSVSHRGRVVRYDVYLQTSSQGDVAATK